jgi:hypothetical protein
MRRSLVLALLIACNGDKTTPDSAAPPCPDGRVWDGTSSAFDEATADWGLEDIDPRGIRISAVDFDGDGWVDLAVRSGSADNWAEGTRGNWLLRNTGAGSFEDVTESSGIVARRDGDTSRGRPGAIWAFADVDGDGDLDVYTGHPDREGSSTETSELMFNNGDGTFSLGPEDSELRRGEGDMPYGVAFVDYDRDGDVDLWVTQYDDASGPQRDRLYRNRGDGVFREVAEDQGIESEEWRSVSDLNEAVAHTRAWAALACDLDDDGWPELLSSSYGRSPNHLWRAQGDGTYANESIASGYAFDHRVDWSDNESARCWCTLHPDDTDCEGVPEPELISCSTDGDAFRWDHDYDREPFRLGGNSGATLCLDADNDGHMDLLTTEIVHWDVGTSSDPSELLFNTGQGVVFERPGNEATGLTREHELVAWNDGDITASAFDFDNDGQLDIWIGGTDYEGARGLLFHNQGARRWSPVPLDIGIDHTRAHGSAVADFDKDGDLDIVVGHSTARCEDDCYETNRVRFFENKVGQDANAVSIELVGGGGSNAAAVGARLTLVADGRTQVRQVDGGHGQFGQQDAFAQHFGIGEACAAELTVRWPDEEGSTQTVTVDRPGRFRLTQGGSLELLD